MTGFGLDLAGFSNRRGTVLATIQAEKNRAEVILSAESPFSKRLGDGSELDAIICALAAVATSDQIVAEDEYSRRKTLPIPAGYRLLNKKNEFEEIRVSRMPFGEWIGKNQRRQ